MLMVIDYYVSFSIGIISFFSMFSFKPEHIVNSLNSSTGFFSDMVLDTKSVVSSAIRAILNSVSFDFIPLISLLFQIFIAIISATNINNKADIGQPCLIERLMSKNFEKYLLFPTQDFMSE